MSDNRQRPRIHRCDDKHDAALRAYARSRGIEPWEALEVAIERLKDDECDGTIDRLTKERDDAQLSAERLTDDLAAARKVAADLRAELASAREATRRADERIAELETAPRLPPELDRRVKACIAAAPNARPPRDFLFVVRNGCDRIEISDRYRKK